MTRLESALGRWVALCERNARTVIVVIALATLAAGLLAWRHSSIDSDLSRLIRPSPDLRWYQDDIAWKAAFPQLLQTAVVVVSGDRYGPVTATTRRLRDAFEAEGSFRHVFAPGVDPFLADHRLYYLDEDLLERWIEGARQDFGPMLRLADSADLANAALTYADQVSALPGVALPRPLASIAQSFEGPPPWQIALEGYPHLQPEVDDTHYELIVLQGEQRLDERLPNAAQVARIETIVAATARDDGVRVRLTGEVKLADEEIGAALEGIALAGGLSTVLLALILGFGVRSLRVIVAIFTMLASGIVLTLGWATLAVGSYNTLALIFVVMFFGLGVDFAVHYALRTREPRPPETADDGAEDAVSGGVAAARDIGPALLLCMCTTSAAFLAFVPTAYRGLGELGIISAGGMVIATALALTLLPALFAVFGHGEHRAPPPLSPRAPGYLRRHTPAILVATLLLALVAAYGARDLRFDYSVLAMRDAGTEGMSTLLELQEAGQATDYSISVLAPDAGEARRLAARLGALPEVAEVATPDDLIPTGQARKRALLDPVERSWATIDEVLPGSMSPFLGEATALLREVANEVPDGSRDAHGAFVAALERLTAEERTRLDGELRARVQDELDEVQRLLAAPPFTLDDLPESVRALLVTADGRQLLRVQPAEPLVSRAATDAFVHAVAAVAPNIAGRTVVEWGVGDVVVQAFVEAAGLALLAILAVLLIYFRSLVLSLLVLIPIGLAALVTAAIAEQTGLTLNMANILVVPLIFGLGVDAGIHVVHRFTRDGGLDHLEASSTPRAVLISGLTTIGTFLSLSFSPHKGAASIGVLLFIAISLMLLATFVVLPALLELRARLRARGATAPTRDRKTD
ncbi:MAG TPA: MMPL family transporter [Pseudomonadales bacterium]|nr:MMPL family transporter [Pseudomonadales bacterium]